MGPRSAAFNHDGVCPLRVTATECNAKALTLNRDVVRALACDWHTQCYSPGTRIYSAGLCEPISPACVAGSTYVPDRRADPVWSDRYCTAVTTFTGAAYTNATYASASANRTSDTTCSSCSARSALRVTASPELMTIDYVMFAFAVVVVAAIIAYTLQRHRRLHKTTAELRHTESLQERLLYAAHGPWRPRGGPR